MTIKVPATLLLLLVLSGTAVSQDCDLFNDPCQFALDLECDAGTFCPVGSDCFDCDPFQEIRDQGCDACIANGGRYCETIEGAPVCSAPAIAALAPNACTGGGGTPYVSTCSDTEPPPSGDCDILNDPCPFTLDLECDDPSGLNFCPANSDCFDCDPFQQFRDQGCNACVSNGGRYCETVEGAPVCSAPDIAAIAPSACSGGGGTLYVSTCSGTDFPPTDGDCDLLNDPCPFTLDLECDDPSGLNFCPANSDCFDCDPFQQFRFQGCGPCVAEGGRYCETADGTPVCSDPDIAALAPNACSGGGGTPYASICAAVPSPISFPVPPPVSPSNQPSVSTAPSISHEPSVSMMPSLEPSISHMPSVSMMPSIEPSISQMPSISMMPSVSTMPSNQPSISQMPSDSMMPSSEPTSSQMPSVSTMPSMSAVPSSTPQSSGTPTMSSEPSVSG